jgi:chromosome segregation ATPase
MRRTTHSSLHDRHQVLLRSREETEAEIARLQREEKELLRQVRQAQEQVRYYETLLTDLRRDWGRSTPLTELVRRLG